MMTYQEKGPAQRYSTEVAVFSLQKCFQVGSYNVTAALVGEGRDVLAQGGLLASIQFTPQTAPSLLIAWHRQVFVNRHNDDQLGYNIHAGSPFF